MYTSFFPKETARFENFQKKLSGPSYPSQIRDFPPRAAPASSLSIPSR